MATLGAVIERVEPGQVAIRIPYQEGLTQQHGYLHAGAIGAVLDSACGYAALSRMAPGTAVLTVEYKINLVAPAAGEEFIATGRVLRSGKTLTVCTGEVVARSGTSPSAPAADGGILRGPGWRGDRSVARADGASSFQRHRCGPPATIGKSLGVMNVLAIPGSLRTASINAAFCRAAARLAPPGLHVTVFEGLGQVPLFNPDHDLAPPQAVTDLRNMVGGADAVLFASPEYAHGISGVMKNALDWLVSYEGFIAKPVAVINTSPRAHHGYESLLEVLKTMSATLVPEASAAVPLPGKLVTESEMVESPAISSQIQHALVSLHAFLQHGAASGPAFPIGADEVPHTIPR